MSLAKLSGSFYRPNVNKYFVENNYVNLVRAQVLLQDNEKEREVLRREVARSQDQVRHLIGRYLRFSDTKINVVFE
jgi:hypothetical protein